jgi:hypothetical protein
VPALNHSPHLTFRAFSEESVGLPAQCAFLLSTLGLPGRPTPAPSPFAEDENEPPTELGVRLLPSRPGCCALLPWPELPWGWHTWGGVAPNSAGFAPFDFMTCSGELPGRLGDAACSGDE